MASIYKQAGYGTYRIAYTDPKSGRRRYAKGFRDKGATQDLARKLERGEQEAAGGAATVQDAAAMYLAELERLGRTEPYRGNVRRALDKVCQAAKWSHLGKVGAAQMETYLATVHADGRSPRTQNYYRDTWVAFMGWAVARGLLAKNPLASVRKVPLHKRPRRRRTFTELEFSLLLAASRRYAPAIELAACSGLRRKELGQLLPVDYSLGDKPRWHLRPEIVKSRRADVVPMLPRAAELLTIQPRPIPSSKTFRRLLNRGGVARVTPAGQLDFHALRYYFCWRLARKLPIQVVRILMRHGDIRITANLYLQIGIEEAETALLNSLLDGL